MGEDDVADVIAACYGAAAGASPWSDVKRRICHLLDAPFAGLVIGDPGYDGRLVNLFENEHAPLPQWRLHNPFLDPARRVWAGVQEARPVVALGPEVVDDRQYIRSEYYADYGRRLDMRHEIGTTVMVDASSMTALGVYRPDGAGAFGEQDRAVLVALRPHLRRALHLRDALRPAAAAALAGFAVLETMSQAAVLVDADMRVLHANASALALVADRRGLVFAPKSLAGTGVRQTILAAVDRTTQAALRRLVESVAGGGAAGSALRIAGEGGRKDANTPESLIVAVLPVPAALARTDGPAGVAKGLALLFMRELVLRTAPPPQTLSDLFGLTRSEAAVASMLTQGVSTAGIAEARGVSLDTVRTQIRAMLPKVGAANLRELERMLGTLAG